MDFPYSRGSFSAAIHNYIDDPFTSGLKQKNEQNTPIEMWEFGDRAAAIESLTYY